MAKREVRRLEGRAGKPALRCRSEVNGNSGGTKRAEAGRAGGKAKGPMNNLELERTWADVTERVKSYPGVSAPQVDAFFMRLHPQAASEGFLMLTADNDFIKKHIEQNFLEHITRAMEEWSGVASTVLIEVDEPSAAPSAPAQQASDTPAVSPAAPVAAPQAPNQPAGDAGAGQGWGAQGVPAARAPETVAAADRAVPAAAEANAAPASTRPEKTADTPERRGLDDATTGSMSFENFVVGDSNAIAFDAAMKVAEHPGLPMSNPLFIYGKSGLGKTHLLRAIEKYINENMTFRKTVYVDTNSLVDDYVEAGRVQAQDRTSYRAFKDRYESADVLLVDDVQHLQGKKLTLDAVFQMFNKLIDSGKQIILSADRSPSNIDIDERYTSRFNQGMTCDIQPPTVETKLGIIKNHIDDLCAMEPGGGFQLSREAQTCIAEMSGSNIRELKSAVGRIYQQMRTFQMDEISVGEVKSVLEGYFSSGPSRRILVPDVQREVESHYKVSHADLIGKKRSRNIAHARHVAIYLCREMIDLPFGDIGKQFGNRDHTTVMYAYKTIGGKLPKDRTLQEEIELLRQSIRDA